MKARGGSEREQAWDDKRWVEPGSTAPTLETTQKWAVKKMPWTWTNRFYWQQREQKHSV